MQEASLSKKLDKVYRNAQVVTFDSDSKIILMSDCHRGQGNAGDNFLANQTVTFGALEYYFQNGFTYIELGDGDELWENRQLKQIIEVHSDIFWMLSKFYNEARLYLLYGNHDIVKRRPEYMKQHGSSYYCEASHCEKPLLNDITVSEGLILRNCLDNKEIFLIHGHQGDLLNDTLWPLARFLVRYVWRRLELAGFLDPTGAGRPRKAKERIEKRLAAYAKEHHSILIAGHTHRPVFSSPTEGYYFNTGSCVHPRCITGIEIENNHITLVKWSVKARKDRTLSVEREVLEGPAALSDYTNI
ncbi:metallophosphoesterase family protein [Bariatricus massiliensis]|uniref:Metallophosphoesterase family protein n=1 Tax=Bariatricus massiliensis TaxID=1745713 RepID=A0ABS8DE80_9FIRM|nr:metallophosphoesterase [Bariatricus massiliensis]MCB7302834.1 metallophosphoesterase family protein [Bariatricus massiliensis]MCB7374050.1 metallophosphoesterase family protein [Bariatricus massiliensis]MCB7386720.1 metallophosphoesterase family protein [Bariatricus massiliensis]MCB7410882.1 metallophosphoesterase family protein [Bariatricus massiliensis]MCQ5251706.1 metallophosphoesterase family protein [Bariatricus massiliensis]